MSEIKVNTTNFTSEVLESELPVLVDFWATWCGPCQMMGPVIKELADEYEGRLKVAKLDIDENPALADKYQIDAVPTLLVFQGGEVVNQLVGYRPKEDLEAAVQEYLK